MTHKTLLACALALALLPAATHATTAKPALGSFGIELDDRDLTVKPGDDFDRYASGRWFDSYQLKDYESRFGAFERLADEAEVQVRDLVEGLQSRTDLAPGSDEQKVRDYYASFLDDKARNAAGIKPLQPMLARFAAIDSLAALTTAFGTADVDGVTAPIGAGISVDRKDPDRYMVGVGVSGLGLPDKSYYLDADARFVAIRAAYVEHITRMLAFAGETTDGKARAQAILKLETELASKHWDRADRRDRDKTYNPTPFAELSTRYPGFDWAAMFAAQGIPSVDVVNVSTPSAIAPVLAIINSTPLSVWRDYLRFHAVAMNARYLSSEIDDAAFAFTGTVLYGETAQREIWKRAVARVGDIDGLGDAVGKLYVARYFKPESKAAMDELVANLRRALRQNIDQLDWMGAATKAEAYLKLETFLPKIGYPSQWRDYSAVAIAPDKLFDNKRALRAFYNDIENKRVGTKPDRSEWFMPPQQVNAYYNASFNEIVFPAAILQAPFFDVNADAAVNYGGIGAVIGHEMGHGFDDQGSKVDFAGIERKWWTEEDRARFDLRAKALGAQYATYCPVKGQCVNPQLTMGENIGDIGGLSMAYTAYQLSLNGKPAPVIEGLTGDQRFFLAWAQVWKSKYREEALVNLMKSDSHSPETFRASGAVRNMDAWYKAFNVTPGEKLYVAPEDRVRIW